MIRKNKSISAVETGARIRRLREARHVWQEHLAQALNVSRELISKIESGKQFPSAVVLAQLSLYFQVSADYLLFGEQFEPPVLQTLDEVILILKNLRKQL